MNKLYNKFIDAKYGVYAVLGLAMMNPGMASAQATGGGSGGGVGIISLQENLQNQFGAAWTIAKYGFALLGMFYVGTGILRLKAAVDSQGQQVKYGEGIWRIALGALLLSVGAIAQLGNQSVLGSNETESLYN